MNDTHYNMYIKSGRRALRTMFVAAVLLFCGSAAKAGVKITGSVYGGGNQANVGETEVNVKAGEIENAVYGGCNSEGTVSGDAVVTLTGGTVGTAPGAGSVIGDAVFGGGRGEPTLVNGNVEVNVGRKKTGDETDHVGTATINGNVYGGSALGNTNASKPKPAEELVFNADKTTTVNLYAGTINGNVFGGGLGQKAVAAQDAVGTEGEEGYKPAEEAVKGIESFVGGNVYVTLDGAKLTQAFTGEGENRMPLTGQIFGANNLNGTPKGHVTVHVKRTVDSDKSSEEALAKTRTQRTTYDVAAVYGGGNQADYIPTNALLDPNVEDNQALIDEATAEVIIDGCDATSIEYVYGGGNAAAVPATKVTINGSYIIHQVFGGGNGKSTSTFNNPGANIGIYNKNGTPTNYGTGKTFTKLVGGKINEVYGGSNTLGNVRGGTTLKRETPGAGACELEVGEIYGAGQVAPMDGDVNITLECMPESFVEAVYGGAKNAVVNGNVSLTVTSGKYGRVFGGNNEGGSINGSITVNAYEDGCQPLIIGELYGGGFKAPYSIYGCTQSGDTWLANESGDLKFDQADRAAIQVNVYSCTSIGKVFGGGYQAPVIGNTHVWINMMKGLVDNPVNPTERIMNPIGKIGQVFGGGNEAVVKGNTTIYIGTALSYNKYGTTKVPEDMGVNIEDGNDYLDAESDTPITLTAGIYGGGNAADVEGNTTLNIGTANQNQGINIQGDIFGGGYGEDTHVTGNVTVNIGKDDAGTPVGYANITGDVYGGSAKGTVNSTDNSDVNTYTPEDSETPANCYTQVNLYGGTLTGNIHGGGLGDLASLGKGHADVAADVYGPVTVNVYDGTVNKVFGCNNVLGTPKNTVTVNINGGTVNNSVYGGGNQAAYTPVGVTDYPAVKINNGTITGNVFGGGYGTTATVTGNPHVTISDNADIRKSVYGGGEQAQVAGSTDITVSGGTIGTPKDGDTVYGGAEYGNIYGGGLGAEATPTAGLVSGNTNITVSGGTVLHNIYGGGAYGSVGTYTVAESVTTCADGTGTANITITGGTIGTDGHENGMVFGSARGDVSAPGGVHDRLAWVNNTNVIIGLSAAEFEAQKDDEPYTSYGTYEIYKTTGAPQIKGSVYGGGENGHTYNNASVTIHSGTVGITDTSIDGGAAYAYRGNVYGAGCGTDKYIDTDDGNKEKYNPLAGIVQGNTTVTIDGGHVVRNVYGAGAMGSVTGGTTVNISGGTIGVNGSDGGNVYAAARGEADMEDGMATVGSTALNISGGTIWGSAFGGGQLGTVKGNVTVNVSGGQVVNDVYGGGALANTNTANWNTEGSATEYVEVTGLTPEAYAVKSVTVGESVVGLYTLDNGNYIAATGTAASGTTYYERTVQGSSVAGYYTRSVSEGSYVYTLVTTGAATSGTKYYREKVVGSWVKTPPVDGDGYYTTTVNLTGGLIGNAYGGGLGQLANGDLPAIAAMVYGDVKITVNDPDVIGTAPGVAFTQNTTNITYGVGDKRKEYVVPLTGRVFGCNNQNGTPTGDVRVEVYSTRQIDANNNIISGHGSSNRKYPNEIRAVYGGGNLSDYLPADGKGTSVYIEGCDVTSIEKVYGGGNSASVPTTDVTIKSCYDVGYAFGGGNGGDLIYKNGNWTENEGAIVIGLAKITPMGGKIGQVFGGSDAKGVCGNTTVDLSQQSESDCPLVLTRIYGAGNEADVSGDVNMIISGCGSGSQTIGDQDVNTQIEYVYGGSYNAHITGNVTLTISSGIFKYVYGGNDRTGSIGGNITVNIEERDDCNPIIIENLLGGGNEAAYPGTRRDGTEITTAGKITVNVKSATYIGSVYGGSYKADVNGDTEVNINMTKGLWAGAQAPAGYSDLPNVNHASYAKVVSPVTAQIGDYYEKIGEAYTKTSDVAVVSGKTYYVAVDANADVIDDAVGVIDDAVGVIGTVYGGGNQGVVRGSSIVNIGTATTVQIIDVVTQDGGKITDISYKPAPVLGARITGDVFGGGNEANINQNTTVNICTADHSGTTGFEGINIEGGSVYGGGNASDVLGNTTVTMGGGYVFDGVYGGGLKGSVGTAAVDGDGNVLDGAIKYHTGAEAHAGCIGKIVNYKAGTGKCTVVVSGGQVGPVEAALADGGGMKNTGRYYKDPDDPNDVGPVDYGFVFGAGRGEVEDPATDKDADFRTFVKETDVTVGGTAFIMASVYGGGENGRVRTNTLVKIRGGQIGCGKGKVDSNNKPVAYTEDEWSGEEASNFTECASWVYGKTVGTKTLYLPYDPLAPADTENSEASTVGSDGHTYYGSVFGGGSGYYPYMKADGTHDWLRSAGMVEGNTEVLITGGHILTCVYGGNELTDVTGKATVKMTGGTLGVPRTDADAAKRPVTCYLFGGGKGDQRTHFNTWTNVGSTEVEVSGTARIFGSVFGGGEDGHILGNAAVNIGGTVNIDLNGDDDTSDEGETFTAQSSLKIGTTGTSYVDGNVFGGGRGFSGEALTAGSVGGNVTLSIEGGTMLGSVYGGGRLASVGIGFTETTDPSYGQLIDDTDEDKDGSIEDSERHGHIKINISGGTIGKDFGNTTPDGMEHSGNVFGGSMGRIKLLNGSTNPLWPKLAVAKLTEVNITGGTIKRNVYGGGEFGVVRNHATVNISGDNTTIDGCVYGGGLGSDDNETKTVIVAGGYDEITGQTTNNYLGFTPMEWAGAVSGNTYVNIFGGWVKRSVYGGGELASVGLINYFLKRDDNVNEDDKFTHEGDNYAFANIVKHTDLTNSFALSWPYKFQYIAAAPNDLADIGGGKVNGKATVNITGGRIGITGKDYMGSNESLSDEEKHALREDNGDVYGGGKGKAGDRYKMAFCANVKETEVTVKYKSSSADPDNYKTGVTASSKGSAPDCIAGSVYGGGENGHVYDDTKVIINAGLIGHAVYGGGKGKDKYHVTAADEELRNFKTARATTPGEFIAGDIYSITAGKVYGNTRVTMSGGYVVRNVYGGGNMASVGKGNYAGGEDDYSKFGNFCGYGEAISGNLWDGVSDNSKAFLESGKATVTVTGGTVGTVNGVKDDLPTGNVVGGSRGEPAPNVFNMPVHEYNPTFHVGNINEAEVIIGKAAEGTEGEEGYVPASGPRIYGSVYGGGQDGHMRRDSKVTIYSGEIGNEYTTANQTAVGTSDLDNLQWEHRGNVYGSGSGIGQFVFDYDGDGYTYTDANKNGKYDPGETVDTFSYDSDGDGVEETYTDVGLSFLAGCVARFSEVDIRGGIIHSNVYGGGSLAGTGMPKFYGQDYEPYKKDLSESGKANQGKQSQNTVSISGGTIGQEGYGGNVYGASRGEESLAVGSLQDERFATSIWTDVNITGGTIYNNVYGGGEIGTVKKDTEVNLKGGRIMNNAYGGGKGTVAIPADVGGNATVELNNGVKENKKGCVVKRIFGCNDLNGSPKGRALVHVYATQHPDKPTISESDKHPKYDNLDTYTISNYSGLTTLASTVGVDVTPYTTILTGSGTEEVKQQALADMLEAISLKKYDVLAVYGGGDLAPYKPYGPKRDGTPGDYKNTTEYAEVIIDGCGLTSIKQVYGNGNAASSPASHLTVYGAYEIHELFGGGNGKDDYQIGTERYKNPGADVGYYLHHHYDKTGSQPYEAILNTDASNKSYREANYSYGTGIAETNVYGGRIHLAYGGSNVKGNIRSQALSTYETASTCDLIIDHTYGAGKDAIIDGESRMTIDCVDYMARIFGGSTNSNVNSDINLTITNGVFGQVFGGNDRGGQIDGSITVNIKESGCKPIVIDELYGGGYQAGYSIYGYYQDGETWKPRTREQFETAKAAVLDAVVYPVGADEEARAKAETDALVEANLYGFPKADPRINIISATKIGDVYGGGYQAEVIGSPTINVNMEEGHVTAKYAYDTENGSPKDAYTEGKHTLTTTYKVDAGGVTYVPATGTYVSGTTYYTDATGATEVTITTDFEEGVTDVSGYYVVGSGSLVERTREDDYEVTGIVTEDGPYKNNAILKIGTIGNIYGGGNEANVIGNASIEIGTGEWFDYETKEYKTVERNAAFITGNVYGGGKLGHVGDFTLDGDGKPDELKDEKTGTCTVTISNGEIGPDDMTMTADGGPVDAGHVFGGGQGATDLYYDNSTMTEAEKQTAIKALSDDALAAKIKAVNNLAFVNDTEVTINGTAFVKGSVYGGSDNGHVLGNTHVTIDGKCQIGSGFVQMNDAGAYLDAGSQYDLKRPYTDDEWEAGKLDGVTGYENSLPECASWPYGQEITYGGVTRTIYAPHDKFAAPGAEVYDTSLPSADLYKEKNLTQGGRLIASDGHTFYGNVFAGGSGYYPYAPGKWLEEAGQVYGNTELEIKGGHILTNAYGGNEMTNVLGNSTITMTGGTLGVPRTLGQITAHPVTCYLFGAGKGDQRIFFNKQTNVQDANVNITGGRIYGSVFGGGEDGHVQGNVRMNIGEQTTTGEGDDAVTTTTGPKIGTWGTSYVDGNVFGGGRGFSGDAYTAGNVAGSVTLNILGGQMLGSVYGGGRLASVGYDLKASDEEGYGEMSTDANRGHVEINISGGTIGNDLEFVDVPTNVSDLDTWKATNHVPKTAYETTDNGGGTYTHRLLHTRGGNVYAGGMGTREKQDENNYTGIDWRKLGNVKSTKLTITGGTIKSNVYGGGEYGAVRGNHMVDDAALSTEVSISNATIGTEIKDAGDNVVYTFGSVYGGGTGDIKDATITTSVKDAERVLAAFVTDSTRVTVTDAKVRGSVFGGAELASVGGSTQVTISGDDTEIGRNEVRPKDDPDNPGYVMFGGATMGNVYGGGRGSDKSAVAGLVQGNTNVRIEGGHVYHNVYGGGALGSVGSFFVSGANDGGSAPGNIPDGVPYWSVGPGGTTGVKGSEEGAKYTGLATVTITGGTIGISGRDNGMVFGSSRGDIAAPEPYTVYYTQAEIDAATEGTPAYDKTTSDVKSSGTMDPYNKVAWVRATSVNIGTEGKTTEDADFLTSPLIKGSVYGGGENGHNYRNATVNINSGTIGIADVIPGTETPDPWWDFGNESLNTEYRAFRGNVYGAGDGFDTYTLDDKQYHSPRAGMVGGSTVVNIKGGHIGRSVYGAGAMASVGNITNARDTLDVARGGTGLAKYSNAENSFALSWPYKYVFAPTTGKATVNVTGGHIGTLNVDGGDIYGSARGLAGDRYLMAHLAYANETEVNIDYPETAEMTSEDAIHRNYNLPCITGSVHGSGENGYVYGDAKVTLNKGLVGHSLYGAGKGSGTYTKSLNKIGGGGTYDAKIYSLIAGKVMGNTYVTMNGGHVGRNVYGGGNLGSVGKGNYAGGNDDYVHDSEIGKAQGYGEKIDGNLWTENPSANTDAWYFQNSGKTNVKVLGGIVGYIDADPTKSTKNNLPYGNVFGGSAGVAAANIADVSDLYLYCPEFFSGYVNETDVIIGKAATAAEGTEGEDGYKPAVPASGPTILGSVYGGGQDGHVRRDTKVTVYAGEIGLPYTSENQSRLKTSDLDSDLWLHRGNVYGGGSGITTYNSTVQYADGYTGTKIPAQGYSTSSGSVTRFTEVNILGGIIHRNVYGGGSNGSVGAPNLGQTYVPYKKNDTEHGPGYQSQNTVNIGGGTTMVTIGTPTGYNVLYGGNVFGACRGLPDLDSNRFATSIWTKVNIKDKATILGNVFGGGDDGAVLKDTNVEVGAE